MPSLHHVSALPKPPRDLEITQDECLPRWAVRLLCPIRGTAGAMWWWLARFRLRAPPRHMRILVETELILDGCTGTVVTYCHRMGI
jgi:hypothetical protein